MTTTATNPDPTASPDPGPAGARDDAPDPAPDPHPVAHLRRFWWWLAAITATALAVRLTYLFGWRTPWPVVGDAYY